MAIIQDIPTTRDVDWLVAEIERRGSGTLCHIHASLKDLIPVQRQLVERKLYMIKERNSSRAEIVICKYNDDCHCISSHHKLGYFEEEWTCDRCTARHEQAKVPKYTIDRRCGEISVTCNHPLILEMLQGVLANPNYIYSFKLTPELEAHLLSTYGAPYEIRT